MKDEAEEADTFEQLEVFSDKMKKCIRYLLAPSLSEMGLKSYHILIMLQIERHGGLSQKEIREHVPFDKSRVSMIVSELIAMGLAVDESIGKTSSIRLTENGSKACDTFRSKVNHLNGEILSALDEKDHQEFLRCMAILNARIDELIAQHELGSGLFAENNPVKHEILN